MIQADLCDGGVVCMHLQENLTPFIFQDDIFQLINGLNEGLRRLLVVVVELTAKHPMVKRSFRDTIIDAEGHSCTDGVHSAAVGNMKTRPVKPPTFK